MKYPKGDVSDQAIVNIVDDSNEKEINNPRIQALFERSRRKNISIFIISQDYYELRKTINRANGDIYHIFKSNSFRGVQKMCQDKASMDMALSEFSFLTFIC